MSKYESLIYRSIENRAKEILKETGDKNVVFDYITDKMVDLLKTTFNGTSFISKLVELRSEYEN